MTLAEFSYLTSLFANDLQCMHHHASGKDFDQVHELTEEYYNQARELADFLAEKAIMTGEGIDNFTYVNKHIDETMWPALEAVPYDLDVFIETFNDIGNRWLTYYESLDPIQSSTKVALDEEIEWWRNEINYKNAAKMLVSSEEPYNEYLDLVGNIGIV